MLGRKSKPSPQSVISKSLSLLDRVAELEDQVEALNTMALDHRKVINNHKGFIDRLVEYDKDKVNDIADLDVRLERMEAAQTEEPIVLGS